jgi:hypothetical protein
MTEFNPAAEADKLVQQALADSDAARTTLKTDASTMEADVKNDVEKAVGDVKPAEATIQTDAAAVKVDATADVAAAKTEVTTVETTVAVGTHGLVSSILAEFEAIPSEISAELTEAKSKRGAGADRGAFHHEKAAGTDSSGRRSASAWRLQAQDCACSAATGFLIPAGSPVAPSFLARVRPPIPSTNLE